ncbi:hypothetical protein ACFWWM_37750 [Streptomyces sp. NPDC058682]|uniref:hypothetical protein n=1 Tax=Streptomyces sp. NPDC058682 TaxID=3346596 RepID=UPI00365E5E46
MVLGFDHEHRWLDNRLRFPQAKGRWGSHWNPFQTFAWGDYRVKPGQTYTYRVHSVTGTRGEELTPASTVEVQVRTEEPGVQGVWFNRGAYASQAYAERFKNLHPADVPHRAAWRWLPCGLEEALLAFIGNADGDLWQLHAALYEFAHLPVLEAFRVAAETGVDVRLVVFDHPHNRAAVTAAGIDDLVVTWRTRATIPHNEFVVASHDGAPRAVWTGSANITENGIFGRSNVGHAVTDAAVARQYRDFQRPRGDPFHRVLPPVQPPPLPGLAPLGRAPADARPRDGSRSPGTAPRRALVGQVLRRTGAGPPTAAAGRFVVARAVTGGGVRLRPREGTDRVSRGSVR